MPRLLPAVLLSCLFGLTACGQSGDLYLPDQAPQPQGAARDTAPEPRQPGAETAPPVTAPEQREDQPAKKDPATPATQP